jgi:hypothetical protein
LGLSSTCATLACGNILMHTRGRPSEWHAQPVLAPSEILPLVLRDLAARADAALAAGIARDSIVLDPGFGFGKLFDENLPLLARFDQLHTLGYPLLAGLSRKSFLTGTQKPPQASAPRLAETWELGHRVPHSSRDVSRAMGGVEQDQSLGVSGGEAGFSPLSHATKSSGFSPGEKSSRHPERSAQREVEGPPHLRTAPSPSAPPLEEMTKNDSALATSAANMAAVLAGAHILRVHDVAPARQVAALADRLLAVGPDE